MQKHLKSVKKINDIPTILYHSTTSDCIDSLKEGIDIMKGNKRVDFGAGFYLTGNYDQARQWARFKESKARRSGISDVSGVIIQYKLNVETLEKLNCLIFNHVDSQWAEFIYANRAFDLDKFHNQEQEYDCVYGPLADGIAISVQVRELQDKEISFETFLNNIIGYKHPFPKDHQISFHTINAIQALQLKGVETHERQRRISR